MNEIRNLINKWVLIPMYRPIVIKQYEFNSIENPTMVTRLEDLVFALVNFTTLFIIVRYCVVEPFIIVPLGKYLGIKQVKITKALVPVVSLEKLFNSFNEKPKVIPPHVLLEMAQQIGWTEHQIRLWLKERAEVKRNTTIAKFCDCMWHLIYYILFNCLSGIILWDKPWLWDINECWINYPNQKLDNDVRWYYLLACGFYCAGTLTILLEHKRKDALQMLVHHCITILLISLSWTTNFIRIGTLVLLIHETADVPLLAAKISSYLGYNTSKDVFFYLFLINWVVTRLGLFPFWILKSTFFAYHQFRDPVSIFLTCLLCGLMVLHLMWSWFICKIIYKKITSKQLEDARSDDESVSD